MELVQIVPALPPAFSGVGDFAVRLAGELLARHGVGTRFVVGDPGWSATGDAEFPASPVAARTSGALLATLEQNPVLLHYVNYGYAARGCPFWLADALERWKRRNPSRRRLIVLFHELYASGPPWTSVFWPNPFQRWIAVRMARVANARRITTTISRREMQRMFWRAAADLPVTVAPVFSTLGEPASLPPLAARERQVIVFGSRPVREEVYARASAGLEAFCARHGVGRVVDVGVPISGGVRLGGGIEVREAGALPAPEAGALFANSLAGYFNYPAPHLGKSTIFAAYCAHGMLPVTFPGNDAAQEGLLAGKHYLAGDDGAAFETVADAAHAWYRGHRLAVHAHDICSLMQ